MFITFRIFGCQSANHTSKIIPHKHLTNHTSQTSHKSYLTEASQISYLTNAAGIRQAFYSQEFFDSCSYTDAFKLQTLPTMSAMSTREGCPRCCCREGSYHFTLLVSIYQTLQFCSKGGGSPTIICCSDFMKQIRCVKD